MGLKVYVDLRSQPCRALTIFLKNTTIPYELEYLELFEGDHKKPELAAISPLMRVPAIQDDDFCLSETVAIVRYLTSKYPDKYPDHWYPADLKRRAKVDEYMAFHHQGIRGTCCGLFRSEVLDKIFTGKTESEEKIKEQEKKVTDALDKLENVFLKDNKYLCGNEISFADIFAVSEMMQNTIGGRDVTVGRPKLRAFVDRVQSRLNPGFDEVHDKIYRWRDTLHEK